MSDKYNFDLNLGESFVVAIQWLDDADAVIDLTGWTGELVTDFFTLSLALDASGNITGQILDTTAWTLGAIPTLWNSQMGTAMFRPFYKGKSACIICLHGNCSTSNNSHNKLRARSSR